MHFSYSYGLKIATLSSKKLGDSYEGSLKNNYLYQGAYSELDEDIGWTDFALRNYDAQVGRWVQQDPFQQFATPYVGMGDDPVNSIDPSGGVVPIVPAGEVLSMTAETAKTLGNVVVVASKATSHIVASGAKVLTISRLVRIAFAGVNIVNTSIATTQAGRQATNRPYDWIRYTDQYGHDQVMWLPNHTTDEQVAGWAKWQLEHNGFTNVQHIGKRGIIERGFTDNNKTVRPYQLNEDGHITPVEEGKPELNKGIENPEKGEVEGKREGLIGGVEDFTKEILENGTNGVEVLVESDKVGSKALAGAKSLKVFKYFSKGVAVFGIISTIDQGVNQRITRFHAWMSVIVNLIGIFFPEYYLGVFIYDMLDSFIGHDVYEKWAK